MKKKTVEKKINLRTEWTLDKWYEKVIYVIGIIYFVLLAIAFIGGFLDGWYGY